MKHYIQMCAVLSTAALMTLWCKLMILHQVWHELASGPVYVNTLYKLYIQLQVCLVQSITTKNLLFRPAEPTCLLEVGYFIYQKSDWRLFSTREINTIDASLTWWAVSYCSGQRYWGQVASWFKVHQPAWIESWEDIVLVNIHPGKFFYNIVVAQICEKFIQAHVDTCRHHM